MTQLIRGLCNLTSDHQGAIVTIGNFDGVHIGHKQLIKKIKDRATALGVPSIVITFEPQPKEFFAKKSVTQGVARLTRWREKFSFLKETGVDYVLLLRFNQNLANLSASSFINHILVDNLAIRGMIIGDDFRFGANREGDFHFLKKASEHHHFSVECLPSVIIKNERVSSTRIRQLLAQGDHALAEELLGRPYSMKGRVVHGDKLGRQLGFPTANIYVHRKITPLLGIYPVRVYGIQDMPLLGVANIGVRPTIGGSRILLEVFLLDFNRDIYGYHVCVEFCEKLRDELYFENLDLLKAAIAKDVIAARNYFKRFGEL